MKRNPAKEHTGIDISSPEYSRQRKTRIGMIFSLIGALILLFFVVEDIVKCVVPDIVFDSAILLFLIIFALLLPRLKRQRIWFMLVIFTVIGLIVKLVYSGPSSHGGNFIWFLIVPAVSFLLLGKLEGLIPSVFTAILLVLLFFAPDLVRFDIRLALRFRFHIGLAFLALTSLTWIYEYNREILEKNLQQSWNALQHQKKDLHEANENLNILINETNHRISNNLSMINALIQIFRTNDTTKEQALAELDEKIHSIGNSNRMLYIGGNGSSINMKEYLTELLSQLEQTFTAKAPDISVDIDTLVFHPDIAVRIALVINELITNACKYGIGPGGKISVSLKQKDDCILLSVSNNGLPFPDSVDLNTASSTGFSIIRNILNYLGATLQLRKEDMTNIEIKIPAKFNVAVRN